MAAVHTVAVTVEEIVADAVDVQVAAGDVAAAEVGAAADAVDTVVATADMVVTAEIATSALSTPSFSLGSSMEHNCARVQTIKSKNGPPKSGPFLLASDSHGTLWKEIR